LCTRRRPRTAESRVTDRAGAWSDRRLEWWSGAPRSAGYM
jgi:hypothetical protein